MEFKDFSLNLGGRLATFDRPVVMAIVNVTPDSFYAASRVTDSESIEHRVETALNEGADMIDLGAYSTRPGAAEVSEHDEAARLLKGINAVRRVSREVPLSVDTFRASVAEAAISAGADIVNDISGGELDSRMFEFIAQNDTPYIIMHMRGTPATMQSMTDYSADGGVTAEVIRFLAERVHQLKEMGCTQLMIDPGFGFAKTVEQNHRLLRELGMLNECFPDTPILAGLSRKSMLYKPLGVSPDDVLAATCAANVMALQRGARILRVHDVAAARQVADLMKFW